MTAKDRREALPKIGLEKVKLNAPKEVPDAEDIDVDAELDMLFRDEPAKKEETKPEKKKVTPKKKKPSTTKKPEVKKKPAQVRSKPKKEYIAPVESNKAEVVNALKDIGGVAGGGQGVSFIMCDNCRRAIDKISELCIYDCKIPRIKSTQKKLLEHAVMFVLDDIRKKGLKSEFFSKVALDVED